MEYNKKKKWGNRIALGGFFGGLLILFFLGIEGKIACDWFLGLMIIFLIILGFAGFL